MGKLINADDLGPDAEWDDYYDGFTAYSQSQIDAAEEVKAIPLEKIEKAKEKISKSCYKACIEDDGVIRESKVLEILDKLMEGVGDKSNGKMS